jgi:hypothetical protein
MDTGKIQKHHRKTTIEEVYKMPDWELGKLIQEKVRPTPENPLHRNIGGLERNNEGSFNDEDLMKIISKSIEDPIGKSSPEFLSLPYRYPNLFYSKALLELGTLQKFSALWKSSEFYRPVNGTHPNSSLMISG